MDDEQKKALSTISVITGAGATAGVAIAAVLGAPILIPGLIGAGIASIGAVIIKSSKKD